MCMTVMVRRVTQVSFGSKLFDIQARGAQVNLPFCIIIENNSIYLFHFQLNGGFHKYENKLLAAYEMLTRKNAKTYRFRPVVSVGSSKKKIKFSLLK